MKVCKVTGCDLEVKTRGWCNRHYKRWFRWGDPLGGRSDRYADPEEALEARTEWQGDCLVWTGTKSPTGQGQIRVNGKSKLVHRYVWEREFGEIPDKVMLDHKCYNQSCVNLEHLRYANKSQNGSNRSGTSSKTGHRNVYRLHNGQYQVSITKDGVPNYFGCFSDIEEAARVAEEKRKELFGEFAGRG